MYGKGVVAWMRGNSAGRRLVCLINAQMVQPLKKVKIQPGALCRVRLHLVKLFNRSVCPFLVKTFSRAIISSDAE